jgi:uncharacterized membrane protein YeaQ/YmgE (transglycosylase-associated protein family)
MNFTLTGLLVFLLIAGICGALGRAIAGGSRGGLAVSVALGFLGALVGSTIAHSMRLAEVWRITVDGHSFPILWAIIGAAVVVALVHLLSGRLVRA